MPTPEERVQVPRPQRHKVFKGAKVIVEGRWSGVDCIVRNISAAGAKITCSKPDEVPNEFSLLIFSDRTVQNAKVVWRKADGLGIQFTSAKTLAFST